MYILEEMKENHYKGKAYVHWKSWLETYNDKMPKEFLKNWTLENCQKRTKFNADNTIVAIYDNEVVGFCCWCKSRDEDLINCGEVQAIYILKEHQGNGLGKLLMNECLFRLSCYNRIVIWVLDNNKKAIKFYKNFGFVFDGVKKSCSKKYEIPCSRMILNK